MVPQPGLGTWAAEALSVMGASHLRSGSPCQDASHAGSIRSAGHDWHFAIVADGHGSDRYFRSERGAQIAVDVLKLAFQNLQRYASEFRDSAAAEAGRAYWRDIPKWVVAEWRERAFEDLLRDPPRADDNDQIEPGLSRHLDRVRHQSGDHLATDLRSQIEAFRAYVLDHENSVDGRRTLPTSSERTWDALTLGTWQAAAYGTTLLGAAVGADAIFWLQLGDGAMVKVAGDGASYLVPQPPNALANETDSLCADSAVASIAVGTIPLPRDGSLRGIVLTTDGIPNSYEYPEGFFRFCQELVAHEDGPELLAGNLERWLPQISDRGSGDDVSAAVLIAPDREFATPSPLEGEAGSTLMVERYRPDQSSLQNRYTFGDEGGAKEEMSRGDDSDR